MKSIIPSLLNVFKAPPPQNTKEMGGDSLRLDRLISTQQYADLTEDEKGVIKSVFPYTMTSIERLISLIRAVTYIAENNVPGAFVECGVWQGGSMMAVLLTLLKHGITNRQIYLYDTFEGMPPPGKHDVKWDGTASTLILEKEEKINLLENNWCYATKNAVIKNLQSIAYPMEQIHFIEGKVEETIPHIAPNEISLLRLDTDWYESTLHELQHLMPLVNDAGIVIIDDYGHWKGARKAVDEYFKPIKSKYFMHRIDYTGRLITKIGG